MLYFINYVYIQSMLVHESGYGLKSAITDKGWSFIFFLSGIWFGINSKDKFNSANNTAISNSDIPTVMFREDAIFCRYHTLKM